MMVIRCSETMKSITYVGCRRQEIWAPSLSSSPCSATSTPSSSAPRRRACRDPSGRRQETTSRDPCGSDETRFPRSRTPADGRCRRTHTPALEPSAARPAVRHSRNTQTRRANEARPSARCTAALSQIAPQTPEARPSHPLPPIRAMLPKGEMTVKNI